MANNILENISKIRFLLDSSRSGAALAAPATEILAATKTQGEEAILAAYRAGVRHFGENRVQEAKSKWVALKTAHPDITLHLIGPLQSNKAEEAVALFDVIQTLDRPSLAETLAKAMAKQNRRVPCLVQVNTGKEEQKAGIDPEAAAEFIGECRDRWHLPVTGLMCIPPAGENPAPHFALLHEIAKRQGLSELSMGMSGDFEVAARFGATYVRIGTAIFGERV